ncbi:MAG: AAA+ family ATPase, partial [Betaproteobacteria bacterium]
DTAGLLVKPGTASAQLEAEVPAAPPVGGGGDTGRQGEETDPRPQPLGNGPAPVAPAEPVRRLKRFHGTVQLDVTRVGRDAGRIAEEVIAHLAGLVGSEVTVSIEIEARIPGGVSDSVVRTVTENSRSLKFKSHGFEED